MKCSSCNFNNPTGMLFCGRCGVRLQRRCPVCNVEAPPDFIFCGACGARLSDAGNPATEATLPKSASPPPSRPELLRSERRRVTILFADLSDFTRIAERLDPEELTTLLQNCFSELREEVLLREGWVAKYMGDAMLAVFGATLAHEDDPVRAVRTALALQTRIQVISDQLGHQLEQPLRLHIGVNTGLVVTGPTISSDENSGADRAFTVLGDAVNTAARLQQTAMAGQILVGEATQAATHWAFEYRALPPLTVKGKQDKINAYECLGTRAQITSARGLEGIRTPMLGRDHELQELLKITDACGERQPALVSIIGEAGMGKSRLVREWLNQVDARGIAAERCWIARTASDWVEPYGVARQLFGADTSQAAGQLLELLNPQSANGREAESYLDSEYHKQRLFLLAHEFLTAAAAEQPLLLIVEDAHWADASSLELLRFLAARPGRLPVMFLLVHRPEFEGAAGWNTQASAHAIDLSPLPRPICLELLRAAFGESAAQFPPAVVEMLLQRSGGNPFYLEELLRSLIQQGVLKHEEHWRMDLPTENLVVPDSIQGLLLARMDRLPSDTRSLLQEVSILGQNFSAPLLVAYADHATPLDERLRQLVEDSWLDTSVEPISGQTLYRFENTLQREVAYENMLLKVRRSLHRRAAETIEHLFGEHLEEHLPALAEHYYRAQDETQGVTYLERAGDRARKLFANLEAVTFYRQALELLSETRAADRARLSQALGDALHAQGLFKEAVENWQAALNGYASQNDPAQVMALHRRITHAYWLKGEVEKAQAHLQAGLIQLESQPETLEAAAFYQELANQALHQGDYHAAVDWAHRALELARRLEAYEQAVLAANTLGVALARGGEVDRGLKFVEQAYGLATEHGLTLVAGQAAVNLAVLTANTEPQRAAQICEQGLAEARRIGNAVVQPWFYATLAGSLHACASDYETATRSAEVAIEMDRQLGLQSHLPIPLIVLGQIHQCHARYPEAEQCFQEALSVAEEMGDPQLLYPCLEGLGTLALERGQHANGKAYLERARSVCEAAGFSPQEMVLLPFLF